MQGGKEMILKEMTLWERIFLLLLEITGTDTPVGEWLIGYRNVHYKLKCKCCGRTIAKETIKVLEPSTGWIFNKKRKRVNEKKQIDYAICEECVKSNNGLVVEEDFCMIKWLNLNQAKKPPICDMLVLDLLDEVSGEKNNLAEIADGNFVKFKKEVKNMLTIESLRELTSVEYQRFESGIYMDKEELKLAIENYLAKTKDFWLTYFSDMLRESAKNQLEEFRVLSKEVIDFLKNNKQKIYVEYFFKDVNKLEKSYILKAYEEINTDIKKAQKRINDKEENAANIIELCLKRIMSKQYFRFFSNLVRNRVFESFNL